MLRGVDMSYTVIVNSGAGDVVWRKNVYYRAADKDATELASKSKFLKVWIVDESGEITDYKKLVREVSCHEGFVKKRMKY